MNFEKPEFNKKSPDNLESNSPKREISDPTKLIASEPRLRYIYKTLKLLERESDPLGGEINWRELHEKVAPYENALELSDNIRQTVNEYVAAKIPRLKEKIPAIGDLPDKNLLAALTNNWFEEIEEKVSDQRRKVLLAVMAHIVKRIETKTYQGVLKNASEKDLNKLGLDETLRDLLLKIMDVSAKADTLFIRFIAYSQLTPQPPEKAAPSALFLPGDENPHTFSELFPHETQFIAKGFAAIEADDKNWANRPGGEAFKKYLTTLSQISSEKDSAKADQYQKESEQLSKEAVASGFPIIVTHASEGYYKEPYLDPELKISVAPPDAIKEESEFIKAQRTMADSLSTLGVQQFSENMKSQHLRVANVFGAYGVNLVFNAVAQEKPSIILYLNEQMRTYDRDFPNKMALVKNTEQEFAGLPEKEKIALMQKMSRNATMLHEFAHCVYADESEEAKRLGRKPLTIIDEVKAEIVHKALVPATIEKGGFSGTDKQWAVALLASSLQILENEPNNSPYYTAAVYSLNDLLENGIVTFENGEVEIKDFIAYQEILKTLAEETVSLYQDPEMTERKAQTWTRERCSPNDKVKALKIFLEGMKEKTI